MARVALAGFCLLLLVAFDTAERNSGEDRARNTLSGSSGSSVEDSARDYPNAPPPANLPALFEKTSAGVSDRECVDVGDDDIVRSGEFVAGNFRPYIKNWKTDGQYDKIWWVPLHQGRMQSLTVKVTSSGGGRNNHTHRFSDLAGNEDGAFYPSEIPIPENGNWRLVATSGPDWGCFELDLRT